MLSIGRVIALKKGLAVLLFRARSLAGVPVCRVLTASVVYLTRQELKPPRRDRISVVIIKKKAPSYAVETFVRVA